MRGRGESDGALLLLGKDPSHEDAHCRCHHQSSCPSAGVSQAVQSADVCAQPLVHFDPVAVEFQLRRIQERFVRRKARNNLIDRLDEVDDVGHGAVGHGGGDVSRDRILKRRADVRLRQLLFPGPLSVQDISEALDQDMSCAEHIGQLSDLLCVFDRLIEGHREVMRAEDGDVGIVRFLLLEAVPVDHREVVIVVFLADKAAGVLAEGTYLVLEGGRVADQLGLVQHAVDPLHDLVPHLDPHADVDRSGQVCDVMLSAEALQPVRTAPSCGDDGMSGINLLGHASVVDGHAQALVSVQNQIVTLITEAELHARIPQVIFDVPVEAMCLFGSEMADRAVDQVKSCPDGALADLLDLIGNLRAFDMGIGAEVEVDFVGIVDDLLHPVNAEQLGQITADIAGQRQLPVREGTRAGKSGGDVAIGLAVHAVSGLCLGAGAVFHCFSFFNDDDFLFTAVPEHFDGGENPRRTGSDDQDIGFHFRFLLLIPHI